MDVTFEEKFFINLKTENYEFETNFWLSADDIGYYWFDLCGCAIFWHQW